MKDASVNKRTIRVSELKEETVLQQLKTLRETENLSIETKDAPEAIEIILYGQGKTPAENEQLLEKAEQEVRQLFEDYLLDIGGQSLQEAIGSYLDQRNLAVATMESLTGGLIASALTDVHDSSAHFIGGIVSYSTMLKEQMGVPHDLMERHGVISEETARAMAYAVRKFLHADIGLGITGVAGPDKQENQPVGTVYIAIDGPYGVLTGMGSERCAGSDREENKQAATISALNLLRKYLERGQKKVS